MEQDDQRIASYLMGDLPEAEQAELERRYFVDAAFVDRVIQVETRMLDDYARGRLSDEMRERVARQYLAHPARRERLKFAETFVAKLDDLDATAVEGREGQRSPWQRAVAWWSGPGRAAQFSMAVASLTLMVTAGWLYGERIRLRDELNRVRTVREQRERDLQEQLTTERRNSEAVIAERDRLLAQQSGPSDAAGPARATPAVVSLVFAVAGVRAPGDLPRTLRIPPGTTQVRLQLNLKDNDYSRYGMVLRAVGGAEILSRQGLRPEKTESGWSLVAAVPANQLAAGDYMLTLSGVTPAGNRDDVSTSIFRVEK